MRAGKHSDEIEPRRLLALLEAAASDLGYFLHPDGGGSIIVSGNDDEARLPLDQIRRRLLFEPDDQWLAIISDILGTAVAAAAVDRQAPLDVTDFAAMRRLLRTRIYPDTAGAECLVSRPWAPGLVQRLLIDKVHTVLSVERDWIRYWPTDSALFDLAEHNVRADSGVAVESMSLAEIHPMAEGLPILRLRGPEYLTANIRWLDTYPVTGPAGVLFTIPSKESVYCYPITDLTVIRAITVLASFASFLFETTPWPITPWLYHWHHDTIDLAATTARKDNQVQIAPTTRFLEFLNSLPEPTDL